LHDYRDSLVGKVEEKNPENSLNSDDTFENFFTLPKCLIKMFSSENEDGKKLQKIKYEYKELEISEAIEKLKLAGLYNEISEKFKKPDKIFLANIDTLDTPLKGKILKPFWESGICCYPYGPMNKSTAMKFDACNYNLLSRKEKTEKINYFSRRYGLCKKEAIRKLNATISEDKRAGRHSTYSLIDVTLFWLWLYAVENNMNVTKYIDENIANLPFEIPPSEIILLQKISQRQVEHRIQFFKSIVDKGVFQKDGDSYIKVYKSFLEEYEDR
jgi:hypothetical protein